MGLFRHILGVGQRIGYELSKLRGLGFLSSLEFFNPIRWELLSADGTVKARGLCFNGVTTAGKNYLLDTGFHAVAQVATWYIGLIDNASFSALAAADTMGSHAGWIEATGYSESTRVEWTEGAASSGAVTNSTPLTFTMSGSATINGIFVTSNSAKSSTTGTLWATGSFASPVPVVNGDIFKITYTVQA